MKYNNIIYSVFLVLLLGAVFVQCNSREDRGQDTSTDTLPMRVLLEVAYGEHPQQTYDVYLPGNGSVATTKTMLLIHGGGWTSGDKADMEPFVTLLQKNHPDLAIINVNYVLAGPGRAAFPGQREDIEDAFEHIKSKSEDYKISKEFGVLGTSAGAHLGMLYGFNKRHSSEVKMIVNIVGPADFTDPAYLEAETKELQDILQALQGEVGVPETSFLEEFSPAFLVHSQTPPVLSFYGNSDPLIPNSQHERLDAQLKLAQIQHQLTVYDGGHADWEAVSYFDLNVKLKEFIIQNLK